MAHILHIITDLGAGGAERMLTRVVRAEPFSRDFRHSVICLMDDGVHGPAIRQAGIDLYCLGAKSGSFNPLLFLRLVRLLWRLRPDLVMTWLYHADVLGLLAAMMAGLSPRRVVWNLRSSNTDFSRYGRGLRVVVRLAALLSRLPGCVTVNAQAGRAHHAALGYSPRVWRDLPNAFDLTEWHPDAQDRDAVRVELGLADGDVAFVLSARVDPAKDHAGFLEAASQVVGRYPAARFVLIGQGTESLPVPAELRGKVFALGARADVQRLLRGMDVGVLSSAFGEGFANVLGEAMATGLPCIATDVGAAAAIVGNTGWIVQPSVPAALADAMARSMDMAPDARLALGADARLRMEEMFSIAALAPVYTGLWKDVLDHAAR